VEWATHGLDGGESRFSPLAQITPANVAQMGIAWSADFEARSLRGVEATPLVVDGVMYGALERGHGPRRAHGPRAVAL
jgi:glucose dehydrogenase